MKWKYKATETVVPRAHESFSERAGFARTHSGNGNSNERATDQLKRGVTRTGCSFVEQLGAGHNDDVGDRDRITPLGLFPRGGKLAKEDWIEIGEVHARRS